MPRRSAKAYPKSTSKAVSKPLSDESGGFATGREIRMFKNQLASLSAATVRLALFRGDHALAINTHVITSFDFWL
jgi:hypothetical protein